VTRATPSFVRPSDDDEVALARSIGATAARCSDLLDGSWITAPRPKTSPKVFLPPMERAGPL